MYNHPLAEGIIIIVIIDRALRLCKTRRGVKCQSVSSRKGEPADVSACHWRRTHWLRQAVSQNGTHIWIMPLSFKFTLFYLFADGSDKLKELSQYSKSMGYNYRSA